MSKLKGKTAIITGGCGGAGSAICKLFAQEGANVVVSDFNAAAGEKMAQDLTTAGGSASFVKTDVTSEVQVKACVTEAVKKYGAIDILVNIACIMTLDTGYLHECSGEDFDKDIGINLKGLFYFAKHVLPLMEKQGHGNIVTFSSITAARGILGHAVYGAAKAGVESITRSIAAQCGKKGIRANCIRPGVMANDNWTNAPEMDAYKEFMLSHIPVTRLGTGGDSAPLALFLASEDSFYINGQVITLDGGMISHQPQWKEDMAMQGTNAVR